MLQLQEIKKSLGRFFYQSGVNIAIYSVLGEKESIIFEKNMSKAVKKQLFDFIKLKNIENTESEIKENLLPFSQVYLQQNQGVVFDFLTLLWKKGIQNAVEKLDCDLKNPVLSRLWMTKRAIKLTQDINEIISDWIFDITSKSKSSGLSSVDIVRYLSEKIDEVSQRKSAIITRDIVLTTINTAEYETYKLNHISKVCWKVQVVEENEKECLDNEMAGAIILGKDFPSGHKFPPNGIYCSCYLMPIR